MKVKLLIVDDQIEIISTLKRFLEMDERITVIGCDDPFKALDIIQQQKIHIVLSDIKMPGMDGIELLEKIKRHNGLVQVIMMTAYTTMSTAISCLEQGANDYIIKPFDDIEDVSSVIEYTISKIDRWNEIILQSRRNQ